MQTIIARGDIAMDQPPLPVTITIPEGCARWGVSRNTLLRKIKEGRIKAYKPGQTILVDLDEGDSWYRTSGEHLVDKELAEKIAKENAKVKRKRRVA